MRYNDAARHVDVGDDQELREHQHFAHPLHIGHGDDTG